MNNDFILGTRPLQAQLENVVGTVLVYGHVVRSPFKLRFSERFCMVR